MGGGGNIADRAGLDLDIRGIEEGPVNDIAVKLGSVRSANIVALAAFVARSNLVKTDTLRECVKAEFSNKEKLIPLNLKAVEKGTQAARK